MQWLDYNWTPNEMDDCLRFHETADHDFSDVDVDRYVVGAVVSLRDSEIGAPSLPDAVLQPQGNGRCYASLVEDWIRSGMDEGESVELTGRQRFKDDNFTYEPYYAVSDGEEDIVPHKSQQKDASQNCPAHCDIPRNQVRIPVPRRAAPNDRVPPTTATEKEGRNPARTRIIKDRVRKVDSSGFVKKRRKVDSSD
jgi:hypothetical protein